jgi:hypothetical protein
MNRTVFPRLLLVPLVEAPCTGASLLVRVRPASGEKRIGMVEAGVWDSRLGVRGTFRLKLHG